MEKRTVIRCAEAVANRQKERNGVTHCTTEEETAAMRCKGGKEDNGAQNTQLKL